MIEELSMENIEEGLDFAQRSHADSAWGSFPFSREILRANIQKMIGDYRCFTCIYRKEGKIIGYFFGALGRFMFSDDLLGLEKGIYIAPEHRGGRVALAMFSAFITWCKERNAEPLIEIYFGNDKDNEKVYSFLRKVGMLECGRAFRGGTHELRD